MPDFDATRLTEIQYQVLAGRRQQYDLLVWQTPTLSLTAQAFLFTIAFGNGGLAGKLVASLLALVTALASAQLLMKHRHFELHYARLLEGAEREQGLAIAHSRPPAGAGAVAWSSYTIWRSVLLVFAASAVVAAALALCGV